MNIQKFKLGSLTRNLSLGTKVLAISGLLLSSSTSFAEWQSLSRDGEQIGFNVVMGKKANQLVNVTVPGYDLQKREVNGKTYTVISVPEYPGITEKGNPDVPRLSANFINTQWSDTLHEDCFY